MIKSVIIGIFLYKVICLFCMIILNLIRKELEKHVSVEDLDEIYSKIKEIRKFLKGDLDE